MTEEKRIDPTKYYVIHDIGFDNIEDGMFAIGADEIDRNLNKSRGGYFIVPSKGEWIILMNYLMKNKASRQMWNDLLKMKVRFCLKDDPITQDPETTVFLFSSGHNKTFDDLVKMIPVTSGMKQICT